MGDRPGGDSGNPERTYRFTVPETGPRPVVPERVESESHRELLDALRAEGEAPSTAPEPVAEPPPVPPAPRPDPTAQLEGQVQRVLAEGMYETYAQLPPALQARFKAEGERTAGVVAKLLTETRVRVSRIIAAIRKWLALIPGANRYYLEQEAKLRTDAVLALRRPE